jgi:hypothetical protein
MDESGYGSDRNDRINRSDAESPGIRSAHWHRWQGMVLRLLRAELREVVMSVRLEDVDWCSWSVLYLQGWSARSAVRWALERGIWRSLRCPPSRTERHRQMPRGSNHPCEVPTAISDHRSAPCTG